MSGSRAASTYKEQGNAAFKAGKYDEAIEHYTTAMRADPSDAILPCNRAMAQLKLSKWKEAARDATKSLDLQPLGNSKALFRRGMARKEMGDLLAALTDFQQVVKIDSSNKTAASEVEVVRELIKAKDPKFGTQKIPTFNPKSVSDAVAAPSSSPVTVPTDRTSKLTEALSRTTAVSIPSDDSLLKEVSTTRLNSTFNVKRTGPSNVKNESFVTLKKSRENRLQKQTPYPTSSSSSTTVSSGPVKLQIRNFTDFEQQWAGQQDLNERWKLLQCLKSFQMSTFFGDHLEPELLEEIIITMIHSRGIDNDDQDLIYFVTQLSQVSRFDMLTMFFDSRLKQSLFDILSKSGSQLESQVMKIWNF